MSRISDWRDSSHEEFKGLVARDLDIVDFNFANVRDDLKGGIQAVRQELAEVKEQQKWILRTMWALLVGLMMGFAGIVTTVVVP